MSDLPVRDEYGFYEIRLESIGGLGANLAGKILAEAGILNLGFNGSSFSSYGSEKRGSPVKAFIRFCDSDCEVRINSPVTEPHLIAVFQENLKQILPVLMGMNDKTRVVVNTARTAPAARDFLEMPGGTLYCVDALKISREEKVKLNTTILGAVCRASGFLAKEALEQAISDTLGKKYAWLVPANLKAFNRGFEEVEILEVPDDGKYPFQPFRESPPRWGYGNAPIGGTITEIASTLRNDLSASREGLLPFFIRDNCTDCTLCESTCPDYCYVWREVEKDGRKTMVNTGINYQYCKGCLRCVDICPSQAIEARNESEVDTKKLSRVSIW